MGEKEKETVGTAALRAQEILSVPAYAARSENPGNRVEILMTRVVMSDEG